MRCRELTEFLDDHLANRLPEPQRRLFEQHLAGCRDCRNYLDAYRRAVELGKSAFNADCEQVPPQVPESLVHAILESRRRA